MKTYRKLLALSVGLLAVTAQAVVLNPLNNAVQVNPDTKLQLIFEKPPVLGSLGKIRVFEVGTDKLVDVLDLSIPAGPTKGVTGPKAPYIAQPYSYDGPHMTNADTKPGTPSGGAAATPDSFQLTIIGGFSDGFHFYPVIVHGNTATVQLHHNLLQYNKTYRIQIDSAVFAQRLDGLKNWTFSTKKAAPSQKQDLLNVNSNGSGDFNTVQGAIDFVADKPSKPKTIYIRNGDYEEIVYFRNKQHLTLRGESQEGVVVHYANNEVFNPHPSNISTNEMPGTFPSRRAAFAADHCTDLRFENMTIQTTCYGQAEGLLLNGERIFLKHVTVIGSGDALQTNGTAYYEDCKVIGDGDMILGRGAAFFKNCAFQSFGAFMWIRNTAANHGNVCVNCTFQTRGKGETEIARAPSNGGKGYPYCEAVLLNCRLAGISPIGWGPVGGDSTNVHYWEYNSTDLDGKPIDTSKRHPASRQLTLEKDAALIEQYGRPEYVLNGWKPI
jgi:pectin methylesterase-like acyl-CoA thioesterase